MNTFTDIFSRHVGYIRCFDKPEVVLKISVEKCRFQKQKNDFLTQCIKETRHYMKTLTIEYVLYYVFLKRKIYKKNRKTGNCPENSCSKASISETNMYEQFDY